MTVNAVGGGLGTAVVWATVVGATAAVSPAEVVVTTAAVLALSVAAVFALKRALVQAVTSNAVARSA
jgi:hypothetical protein